MDGCNVLVLVELVSCCFFSHRSVAATCCREVRGGKRVRDDDVGEEVVSREDDLQVGPAMVTGAQSRRLPHCVTPSLVHGDVEGVYHCVMAQSHLAAAVLGARGDARRPCAALLPPCTPGSCQAACYAGEGGRG